MVTKIWSDAVKQIKPYVFKIRTPRGFGTGFLCTYTEDKNLCAIATAAHVIDDSYLWEEPIRVVHYKSGLVTFLREADRAVWLDHDLDTAVIVFKRGKLDLPDTTLPFILEKAHLSVGAEIGWVGFPAMSPSNLCFFSGRNSCWLGKSRAYLVDGVAINGVSGGPAFSVNTKIIGCVSAYLPNRAGATPGLAMISDVDQYLSVIKEIKGWDEARKKAEEAKKKEELTQKQEVPSSEIKENK